MGKNNDWSTRWYEGLYVEKTEGKGQHARFIEITEINEITIILEVNDFG